MIDFSTPEDAKRILSSMNGTEIDGREIRLEFKKPRGGGGRGGFGGRGGGGGFGGRGGRGGEL